MGDFARCAVISFGGVHYQLIADLYVPFRIAPYRLGKKEMSQCLSSGVDTGQGPSELGLIRITRNPSLYLGQLTHSLIHKSTMINIFQIAATALPVNVRRRNVAA